VKKYRHILILLFLCGLVFALYGKTIGHRFNSDDYLVIYHALHRSATTLSDELAEFAKPSWGVYYRPGIKIFFEAMAKQFGLWAGGYHAVSLVCYAILCSQLYLIALALTGRLIPSLAAAIIFMASSTHGEVIFWISSINGVAEHLLTLASFLCFVWWRRQARLFFYPLSVCFFVLALLTKESAIILPLFLIFYDILLGGESSWPGGPKRAAKSCWPFVLIGILFILLRAAVMRQASLPPALTTFNWRILLVGCWYTLIMTLSPIDWGTALGWFDRLKIPGTLFFPLAAILISAVVIVPFFLKKYRMAFLFCWILASAVPVLAVGLVPSERHVVLSSVGAAILISVALFRLAKSITRRENEFSMVLGCIFAVVFAAPGYYSLKQRQAVWMHASEVANNVVEQTIRAYPNPAPDTTFFFLNVPDTIDGALVFRFDNLAYALRLFYGNDSTEAVRIFTPDKLPADVLLSGQLTYFRISAMGGHLYLPSQYSQRPSLATRWDKLEQMQILRKDRRYLNDWDRYADSLFFVYDGGTLFLAPSEELKIVLQELYSLI
jgi:hypothetical protein